MTLDDIINSGDPCEIKRALAVKMFEHGLDRRRISIILSVSELYVTKWNSIYRKDGEEGLLLGYIGSQGYLDKFDHYDIIKSGRARYGAKDAPNAPYEDCIFNYARRHK